MPRSNHPFLLVASLVLLLSNRQKRGKPHNETTEGRKHIEFENYAGHPTFW